MAYHLMLRRARGAFWALLIVLAAPLASAHAADDTLRVPPLLVVHDGDDLCQIADGRDSVLYHSIDYITYPSISPDGRFIALLEYDRQSFLGSLLNPFPKGKGEVSLVLIDRFLRDTSKLGELKFRRVFEGPATERSWLLFAPVWWRDGEHMIIATKTGVDAMHVDGTRRSLLAVPRLSAIAISAQHDRCAFSDGKCLWELTSLDSTTRPLLDSARVDAELGRSINSLAFSRDGHQLAIGCSRAIWLLDIATKGLSRAAKCPDEVHAIWWMANDSGLVVVCGREDAETALRSTAIASGMIRGNFEIRSWRVGAEKTKKLYSQVDFDVRGATASLSPDGRFLAFPSRHRSEYRVLMVLTLDGGKATRLLEDDEYTTPVWLPEN